MEQVIPVNFDALIAIILIGVATPLVVAFAASPSAPGWLTGTLSGVVTGAGAVTAYLVDLDGVPDWKHALGLFVAAVAASAAFRKNIGVPGEKAISAATAGFGFTGPAKNPGQGTTP